MTKNRLIPLVWLPLFLASILPARVPASTWRIVAVAQPLVGEGGMEVRDVPYSTDSFEPGAEVAFTCEPNTIRNVGEDFDEEVENRNAASRFGLSLRVGQVWNGKDVFDTLAVTLDATRADSAAVALGLARPDSVVEATVFCVRVNAARSGFGTRYIKLDVLGPARLQRFSRVYAVEHPTLPRRMYDFGPPVGRKELPVR